MNILLYFFVSLCTLQCRACVEDEAVKYLSGFEEILDEEYSNHNLLLSITMGGYLHAFDMKDGRKLLWRTMINPGALLSSSLSNLEMSYEGVKTRLIPSLDGNLYQLREDLIEPLSISADDLLKTSFRVSEDTMFTGANEVQNTGIDLLSGDVLYTCSSKGCNTTQNKSINKDSPVLSVQRSSNTIIAFDSVTGIEKWNFSVSVVKLKLTKSLKADSKEIVSHSGSDYIPEHINNSDMKFADNLKFVLHEGTIYEHADNNPSQILWKIQLKEPITSSWSIINGEITDIDIFNSNGNIGRFPIFYLGIYRNQAYIQEKGDVNAKDLKLDNVSPNSDSVSCGNGYSQQTDEPNYIRGISYLKMNEVSVKLITGNPMNTENNFGLFFYDDDLKVRKNTSFNDSFSSTSSQTVRVCSNSVFWEFAFGVLFIIVIPSIVNILIVVLILEKKFHKIKTTFRHILPYQPVAMKDTAVSPVESKPLHSDSFDSDNNSKFAENFVIQGILGKGGFGVVFKVSNKLDECTYAVKRISLPHSKRSRQKVMREVKALAQLDHPSIVRYFHSWVEKEVSSSCDLEDPSDYCLSFSTTLSDENSCSDVKSYENLYSSMVDDSISFRNNIESQEESQSSDSCLPREFRSFTDSKSDSVIFVGSDQKDSSVAPDGRFVAYNKNQRKIERELHWVYIQMQLCQANTLGDYLRDKSARKNLSIKSVYEQILSAVNYIHKKNLIHRDLKPSNIFFSMDGQVKVGDFGLVTGAFKTKTSSTSFESSFIKNPKSHTKEVGTVLYMSPEQELRKPYNHKVDIFSLGVILFELLYPFNTEMERIVALTKSRKLIFPEDFTEQHPAIDTLVRKMMCKEPSIRPEAEEVMLILNLEKFQI